VGAGVGAPFFWAAALGTAVGVLFFAGEVALAGATAFVEFGAGPPLAFDADAFAPAFVALLLVAADFAGEGAALTVFWLGLSLTVPVEMAGFPAVAEAPFLLVAAGVGEAFPAAGTPCALGDGLGWAAG
jgi:hypothetical protein